MTYAVTYTDDPGGPWGRGDWGNRGDWHGRGGGWWWPLSWLLLALLVAGIVWAVTRRSRPVDGSEAVVRDLFARGEISEHEYRARLGVLREPRRPAKGAKPAAEPGPADGDGD